MIKKLLLFVVMLASLALPATVWGGVIKLTYSDFHTQSSSVWQAATGVIAEKDGLTIKANLGAIKDTDKMYLSNISSFIAVTSNTNNLNIQKVEIKLSDPNGNYTTRSFAVFEYNKQPSEVSIGAYAQWSSIKSNFTITSIKEQLTTNSTATFTNINKECFLLGPAENGMGSPNVFVESISFYYGEPSQEDETVTLEFTDNPSTCNVNDTYYFSVSPTPDEDGYTTNVVANTIGLDAKNLTITKISNTNYSLYASKKGDYEIYFTGKTADGKTAKGNFSIHAIEAVSLGFDIPQNNIFQIFAGIPGKITVDHHPDANGFKFEITPDDGNITYHNEFGYNNQYLFTAKKTGHWNVKVSGTTSNGDPATGNFTIQSVAQPIQFDGLPKTGYINETKTFKITTPVGADGYQLAITPSTGCVVNKVGDDYTICASEAGEYTVKVTGETAEGYELAGEFTYVCEATTMAEVTLDGVPTSDIAIGSNFTVTVTPSANADGLTVTIVGDDSGLNYTKNDDGSIKFTALKSGSYSVTLHGTTEDGAIINTSFQFSAYDPNIQFANIPETLIKGSSVELSLAEGSYIPAALRTTVTKDGEASEGLTAEYANGKLTLTAVEVGEYFVKYSNVSLGIDGQFTIVVPEANELEISGLEGNDQYPNAKCVLMMGAGMQEFTTNIAPSTEYDFSITPDEGLYVYGTNEKHYISATKSGKYTVIISGEGVDGKYYETAFTVVAVGQEDATITLSSSSIYEGETDIHFTIDPSADSHLDNLYLKDADGNRIEGAEFTVADGGYNLVATTLTAGNYTIGLDYFNVDAYTKYAGQVSFTMKEAEVVIPGQIKLYAEDFTAISTSLDLTKSMTGATATKNGVTFVGYLKNNNGNINLRNDWSYFAIKDNPQNIKFTKIAFDFGDSDTQSYTSADLYLYNNTATTPNAINYLFYTTFNSSSALHNSYTITTESIKSATNSIGTFEDVNKEYFLIGIKKGDTNSNTINVKSITLYYEVEEEVLFPVFEELKASGATEISHVKNDGYQYGEHCMTAYKWEDFGDAANAKKYEVELAMDPDWEAKYKWDATVHGANADSHAKYHDIYVGDYYAEICANGHLWLYANVPGVYTIKITDINDDVHEYPMTIRPVLNNDDYVFALQHSKFENDQYTFSVEDKERGNVKFWAPHWGTVYCYIDRGTAAQANNYQPQGIQLVNVNSEGKPVYEEEYVLEPVTGNTLDLRGAQSIYLAQKVNGVMSEVVPATIVTGKDVVTGVDEVGVDGEAAGKYYTLEGIEVSELQSGHIYIHVVNGKSNVIVVK